MTAVDTAELAAPSEPVARRGQVVAARVTPFVPAVIIAIAGWSHRWVDEDAFINFRIVDNVFAGHGPVFNAGERVEAATSPLWLGILIMARALFGAFVSMPWIALIASLVVAVAAFALGGHAARVVHRDRDGVVIPVGLLLVSSVAVVWDFSTSGLEMGLVWLWLAACWLILVTAARSDDMRGRARLASCVVLGLGPLVRPELGAMMLCFLVAWFVLARPRRALFDVVAIFAVPVAYEIFRMGYYATVVPNTALAKDAGGLHFGQGWRYAVDLISPYKLWVPAVLVALILVLRSLGRRDRRLMVATVTMLVAALVSALYIVAIGGDYMHGRLLLPALFAFALPVSVSLRFDTRVDRTAAVITAIAAVWAVLSIVAFRPPTPPPMFGVADIADWRTVSGARIVPIDATFTLSGKQAHDAYEQGVRGYLKVDNKNLLPGKDPNAFVYTLGSIGVPAWHAGTHIWVIDIGGLAEPLAARTDPQPNRPAGHRKQIDYAWYDARFGADVGDAKVQAAREALTCGPVKELLQAVDGKLTPGRFLSNIWDSFSLTRLKIPYDPTVAEQKWCPRP